MIAFSIGTINIYRYGIFYFISFLVAYIFLKYIAKKEFLNDYPKIKEILSKKLEDILIYSIIGVLIGGRLGHILIYDLNYFIENPLDIFAIWKGGMSFIGGMIGVLISLIIFKTKNKLTNKDIIVLLDLIISIVPFGIMLGRIGNFLNQELYGIILKDNIDRISGNMVKLLKKVNIIHVYEKIDLNLRINTNFLASFFEGFIILVITLSLLNKQIKNKKIKPGLISSIFLILYSFFRFLLEYFRQDSQFEVIGSFSKSQWFFLFFLSIGFVLFFKIKYYSGKKS